MLYKLSTEESGTLGYIHGPRVSKEVVLKVAMLLSIELEESVHVTKKVTEPESVTIAVIDSHLDNLNKEKGK